MSDTRLVPLAAAVWLVALVLPALPPSWYPVALGAALAPGAAALLFMGRAPRVALLLLGLAAGTAVTSLHAAEARVGPLDDLAARAASVTVDLEVRSAPEPRAGDHDRRYVVFDARVTAVRAQGEWRPERAVVLVTASPDWRGVRPGQRLRTVARLAATDRGDERAAIVSVRGSPTVLADPGPVDGTINRVRAGLREAASPLPPAARALLPSLVVGDTTRLSPDLADDMRAAGLTHLTAVSGANLTILLAFVLAVVRAAGIRAWGVPAVGLLVVAGFVLVCRPEPSVLRAAAMGVVGLAGLGSGGRRTGLPALAIAVVALLLVDPWLGRSYGFALSVLATLGILTLAPRWTASLQRWLPRWLAIGLAVPLAAQLAVTPLLVLLAGEISVVAVVANLLTGPAVPVATVFGFAALLMAVALPGPAQLAAWVAFPAVWWIVRVARHAADLPGATVDWPAGPWRLVVVILGCVLAAAGMAVVLRRARYVLVLALLLVLWLTRPVPLATPGWLTGWPPHDWIVAACDVGQGDALVLNAGRGKHVLVDTGPDPGVVDRCLRGLGVQQLELVVLTHFHADHIGGLEGALRGREVERIWIRPVPATVPAPSAASGAASGTGSGSESGSEGAGPRVREVTAGHAVRIGASRLTVLAPTAAASRVPPATPPLLPGVPMPAVDSTTSSRHGSEETEGTAENDLSVVILAELRGARVLLTGDVEPAGQRRLLHSGARLRADVLKVPHHGARYQDPGFLGRASPRLALISVGEGNDYGHPASSTLAYFRVRGIPVARTDRGGTVMVTAGGDGLGLVRRGRVDWLRRPCRRCVGC